jgi:hypothetical protein
MKLRGDELLVGAAGAGSSAAVALGYGNAQRNAAWVAGAELKNFRNQRVCNSSDELSLRRP